jgi:hypothetical protein
MDNVTINITEAPENVTVQITDTIQNVTVEVSELGTQGAQGPKGNIEFVVCGSSISSGNVVYLVGGFAYRFDPSNASLQNRVFGIAKQAGVNGDTIEVYVSGVAEVVGWGLIADTRYYATLNGGLTATPIDYISEYVGVSISSDKLLIKNNVSILTA